MMPLLKIVEGHVRGRRRLPAYFPGARDDRTHLPASAVFLRLLGGSRNR
jgi:hypothetical protein